MFCTVSDCSKKITLIEQTTCKCVKCNSYYCTKHRLSETHNCSHNYREKNEEYIEKYIRMNKCSIEKIGKI